MNELSISGGFALSGNLAVEPGIVPPIISSLKSFPASGSIVVSFATNTPADTQFSCGTTAGVYSLQAADNGTQTGVVHHRGIRTGLQPSTTYFCLVTSTNAAGTASSAFTVTTTAAAATTPITGVTFGPFSSINALNPQAQMRGDTFYNTVACDGRTYFTIDDTTGWTAGAGGSFPNASSNMQLNVFDGAFPSTGHTVNPLAAYGPQVTTVAPDNLSPKNSGLFAMGGNLFMACGRQLNGGSSGSYVNGTPFYQHHGEIMMSPDLGQTWNNWQAPSVFNPTGALTTAAMFGTSPSEFSSATFVMYGADDGSLGYLNPLNRVDGADAYVYLVANEKSWNNGSNYYLARVPRARLARLNVADYQYFTGGDGNADGNWSSTEASAAPILTAANQLSEPSVQYIPALNRYVMLGYYYPNVSNTSNTVWPIWEAPHPWGPWTLVSSTSPNAQLAGAYNPVVIQASALAGNTPYIVFTGDYGNQSIYSMYYSQITLNHQ